MAGWFAGWKNDEGLMSNDGLRVVYDRFCEVVGIGRGKLYELAFVGIYFDVRLVYVFLPACYDHRL